MSGETYALRASSMDRMRRRTWILLLLGAALLTGFSWSVVHEPSTLVIREHELSPPHWPAGLDGIRVALLADLHVGSPRNGPARMERLVEETNAAHPDLVLLAGDFVIHGVIGGTFVEPRRIGEILSGLSAPLGVFAVMGNHDWWHDVREIRRIFSECGIPTLDDRGLKLQFGEASPASSFWLVGISDFWEGPHDFRSALAHVTDDDPVLAFTHNPDLFPELPHRIALTLAGHTHGGQVALPLVGRPIVPSRYGQRYAIGHVVENGRHLFVTPGVGTSILPLRFRVPPEVSLLTLRSAERP